jgi:hypothetical protein
VDAGALIVHCIQKAFRDSKQMAKKHRPRHGPAHVVIIVPEFRTTCSIGDYLFQQQNTVLKDKKHLGNEVKNDKFSVNVTRGHNTEDRSASTAHNTDE